MSAREPDGDGGMLYLAATDQKLGEELWRSNGTRKGTKIVTDIRRGRGEPPDVPHRSQ